jgi:hypothetical protein
MDNEIEICQLWSLRLNPSDLYNIERVRDDNPDNGGGHTYIQIPKGQVKNLLSFLSEEYPTNGSQVTVTVGDQKAPSNTPQIIEFWAKSAGRMRISQQNRHRHSRLAAWSPQSGFPKLEAYRGSADAKILIQELGGLHIYLARDSNAKIWGGYTTGPIPQASAHLPFANILWGLSSPGGHWKLEEED